jgi:TRAP-type C4-dicarboxylate transport system permease small subunit
MRRIARLFADHVAVGLIGTMFASFLLQIAFRYVLNRPLGWTEEVTVICWVWVVLWTASFILTDDEEVRFDIVYGAVSPGVRRAFTIVTSVAIIALLLLSLPATWRYVVFMKREHSAYLHMRFDFVYSIYLMFILAAVVRHGRLLWRALHARGIAAPTVGPDVP